MKSPFCTVNPRQVIAMTTKPDIKSQPQPSERPHAKYLWHAGEFVDWDQATVHISMMVWTSISSVFEGIRAYWNQEQEQLYVFHLDAHLKRLFPVHENHAHGLSLLAGTAH